MNRMTKKRVGMVLAFSLTLTGAAAYIGIQQENTDKTEAAGSLTAGVSASLNASEVEALDVTAGVTSQLYDKTDVAVAANEKQMVAQGIQRAHFETSHLQYNDENALSYTISLALYAARNFYTIHRELAGGKGFADLVFIPKKQFAEKSALVVELKWDKSAEGAIKQIKDKKYFESLEEYQDNLLLIGINYDKKTKEHVCKIEKY